LGEGLYGWPVTDIEVALTAGWCIRITHPGSRFGPVVPLGLFQALSDAGIELLEPMHEFELRADSSAAPAILYDLSLMRAEHQPPAFAGDSVTIAGIVPAATSLEYATRLSSLTGGKGIWRTQFAGYQPCPPGEGEPIERTTPDPLNQALFMQYVRGSMQ